MGDNKFDAQEYGLALLTEECGEVLQQIGKAGRFGLDSLHREKTPRQYLEIEIGDVLAAVDYLEVRGLLDGNAIHAARSAKLKKLLDPNSVDNLGKRLAP